MNRRVVEAEVLSREARRWMKQNCSDATWRAVGFDRAVYVSTVLLAANGEAGINPELFQLLRDHSSPAVRALARSADFPNRRLLEKTVARQVAWLFGGSFDVLYAELRRRRLRAMRGENTTASPSEASGSSERRGGSTRANG